MTHTHTHAHAHAEAPFVAVTKKELDARLLYRDCLSFFTAALVLQKQQNRSQTGGACGMPMDRNVDNNEV